MFMKNIKRRILSLLLLLALLVSLAACGGMDVGKIRVDENGLASWNAVKNAVYYEYCIVDAEYTNMGVDTTTETQYQLPEGFLIQVRPAFKDGSFGGWETSDYYGEPAFWGGSPVIDEEQTFDIAIDAKGWATWEAVEGAVEYRCLIVDQKNGAVEEVNVTDTTIRVPLNHRVDVSPVMADGAQDWTSSSAYRGGGRSPVIDYSEDAYTLDFTARISEGKTYSVVENIDYTTLKTDDGGKVTFTATGPDGEAMRFSGTGITVAEGAITIEPGGSFYALDAIGRICAYKPIVSDPGSSANDVEFTGGYTFDGGTSVEHEDELFKVWPISISTEAARNENYRFSAVMEKQANMIGLVGPELNQDSFTLSELIVYYDEATDATPISSLCLNYDFYGTYLEGDLYDPAREVYDPENKDFTFYLMILPELQDDVYPLTADFMTNIDPYLTRAVIDVPMDRYEIGDLKDPSGKVLNKETDPLTIGCTLEITIEGRTYDMELPILERATDVQTFHELTPYSNIPSTGEVTSLVVPVQWSDYADPDPESRLDKIRGCLGRVVDESGTVTDYSADLNSLSAYYDAVSCGKYHIESFLTDWVTVPYTVEEGMNLDPLTHSLPDEIFATIRERYPELDWSKFDRNADGIVDSVIYISATPESETTYIASFLGGVRYSRGYTAERAGTPEKPNLKDFICIGTETLDAGENVILHEYAHNFGLIDYYDVSYSGIDAVGCFDMQSNSYGDWNAYSKYAVGWIEPEIVTELAKGESVEITIGSMTETGDAILVPAAGTDFDGPFGEYILVDLFTATGVNEADASEFFELKDEVGVRIYHVNATMERRVLTDKYGDEAVIGTVNIANDYSNSGKYHIELLQRGGDNSFTDLSNLRTQLEPRDFFRAGDVFDAAQYGEFLVDGRMDDGSEFGYTIQILDMDENGAESTATIRITKK